MIVDGPMKIIVTHIFISNLIKVQNEKVDFKNIHVGLTSCLIYIEGTLKGTLRT